MVTRPIIQRYGNSVPKPQNRISTDLRFTPEEQKGWIWVTWKSRDIKLQARAPLSENLLNDWDIKPRYGAELRKNILKEAVNRRRSQIYVADGGITLVRQREKLLVAVSLRNDRAAKKRYTNTLLTQKEPLPLNKGILRRHWRLEKNTSKAGKNIPVGCIGTIHTVQYQGTKKRAQ